MSSQLPPRLALSLDGLNAVAALLSCADAQAWASLGRPAAVGLSVLIGRLTADVSAEVWALIDRVT